MIREQFRQHFVAMLSLFIAIVALTYTAWREEVTEKNRNTRLAAFEVLKNLGELQVIVNNAIYDPTNPTGNLLLGWGHIAIISDMGSLLAPPVPEQTERLASVWGANIQKLKTDEKAQDIVESEIDTCRALVLKNIQQLR